jgi:hypothetical protein
VFVRETVGDTAAPVALVAPGIVVAGTPELAAAGAVVPGVPDALLDGN